jgi:tetratricopeptide (TPR) repeat protein
MFLILFISFLTYPVKSFPFLQQHNSLDERKNEIIISGFDLLYSGKYEKALAHFKKLDQIDPVSAEGIFFEAFVLEYIMDQYRSQKFDDRLNIVLDNTIKKAKKAVKNNPSARNYMFLGAPYGVRGVRQGILGAWWRTFIDGNRAYKYLKRSVEIDPTLYDSYYGIGSYHYWSSKRLRRFFGFLFRDKRMMGIEQLHLSIEKGIFSPMPSKITLFRIYMEEKRYDKVIELAKEVSSEYPGCLFPKWYHGIALIRTTQWDQALKIYQEIMELLEPITVKGPESLIESWYYMGLCYYYLGEYEKAKVFLEKITPYKGRVNQNLFFYDNCIEEGEKLLKRVLSSVHP